MKLTTTKQTIAYGKRHGYEYVGIVDFDNPDECLNCNLEGLLFDIIGDYRLVASSSATQLYFFILNDEELALIRLSFNE